MAHKKTIPMLIVGAGKAGELIADDIVSSKESPFSLIGFIDDDPTKTGETVAGLPVLGALTSMRELVERYGIEEILIAMPSERGLAIRRIIEETLGLKLIYKILPRTSEVLMQDFVRDYIYHIREVRAEDLLGGEILKSDQQEITEFTQGNTVLITGAAGSIGSELTRQIAAHRAQKIVVYDWWENGVFELRNQLLEHYPETLFEFIIGDIKDRKKLDAIMGFYKPSTVFHAAAYKHVPLMESNPTESIKNNIFGTRNVAELAIKHGVRKCILISSDKAVNPTNIMGATKRAAEMVIHVLAEAQDKTIFSSVRFGNVINSNGSVIPIFEKQIENGGPVTLTHPEVTRFFMTIPEAVHLILKSWIMGENNDLFVLDMGDSIKIYDLARLLIAIKGYTPEEEIKIKVTGLRPGEKLYEEVLVSEEQTNATKVKKIFKTKNYLDFDAATFILNLDELLESLDDAGLDKAVVRQKMQNIVGTYHPATHSSIDNY